MLPAFAQMLFNIRTPRGDPPPTTSYFAQLNFSRLRLLHAFSPFLEMAHKKARQLLQFLPTLCFTVLTIIAFTVAGGYSSRISSGMSDEVLINGYNCGILTENVDRNVSIIEENERYNSMMYADAANYAQQCYSENSTEIPSCDRFVVKNLTTAATDTEASCPFPGDTCRRNNSNIRLDTGYIDSHDHLGLNAQPAERFAYRYVLQCAPLKTQGYTSRVSFDNTTWVQYNYGAVNTETSDNVTSLNYTYEIESLEHQYPEDYSGIRRGNFLLR
jgi:hypothetical protein